MYRYKIKMKGVVAIDTTIATFPKVISKVETFDFEILSKGFPYLSYMAVTLDEVKKIATEKLELKDKTFEVINYMILDVEAGKFEDKEKDISK